MTPPALHRSEAFAEDLWADVPAVEAPPRSGLRLALAVLLVALAATLALWLGP